MIMSMNKISFKVGNRTMSIRRNVNNDELRAAVTDLAAKQGLTVVSINDEREQGGFGNLIDVQVFTQGKPNTLTEYLHWYGPVVVGGAALGAILLLKKKKGKKLL